MVHTAAIACYTYLFRVYCMGSFACLPATLHTGFFYYACRRARLATGSPPPSSLFVWFTPPACWTRTTGSPPPLPNALLPLCIPCRAGPSARALPAGAWFLVLRAPCLLPAGVLPHTACCSMPYYLYAAGCRTMPAALPATPCGAFHRAVSLLVLLVRASARAALLRFAARCARAPPRFITCATYLRAVAHATCRRAVVAAFALFASLQRHAAYACNATPPPVLRCYSFTFACACTTVYTRSVVRGTFTWFTAFAPQRIRHSQLTPFRFFIRITPANLPTTFSTNTGFCCHGCILHAWIALPFFCCICGCYATTFARPFTFACGFFAAFILCTIRTFFTAKHTCTAASGSYYCLRHHITTCGSSVAFYCLVLPTRFSVLAVRFTTNNKIIFIGSSLPTTTAVYYYLYFHLRSRMDFAARAYVLLLPPTFLHVPVYILLHMVHTCMVLRSF